MRVIWYPLRTVRKTVNHVIQAVVSRMASFCLGLLCLAFAIPLAAYTYLGSFIRLIGDDYCYAAVLRQFGFWMTQWQSYTAIVTYNGNRYSLNLFSSLLDLLGPKANAALPGLALLLWLNGITWSWRNATRLVGIHTLPLSGLLAAEVLVFFTLSQAPDLDQAFYWRTGMLTYLAPVISCSILLGLIFWQANHLRVKLTMLGATFMLALISAGFSEVGAVAHITGLTCLLVWRVYGSWRRGRIVPPNSTPSAGLLAPTGCALAGSLAALLLLVFSPSTRLNMQTMPPPASLFSTVHIALYSARIFIVSVTIKRMILPNLLLVCFAMAGSALMAAWSTRSCNPHPTISVRRWLLALAGIVTSCLLIVIACMVPNAYTQSGYPELRALIIPRFVLVASVAGCGWLTGWFLYSQLGSRPRYISYASSLLAVMILLTAAVFPIYSTRPILSRVPLFSKWAYLWDQRDQQIRYAASYNQGSVQVLELVHILSGVGELKVGGWYTQCANQYYGIQVVPNLPGWDQNSSP
jgi:hypothetical protein